ncbi:small integral membrane protein 22 isoform 1-T4 [Glossophaga mutica]
MDNLKELESTAEEVLGKLRSHRLFQSTWDTAAFIIFLLFLGTVLLLLLLACLHCCCCYRSSRSQKVRTKQVNPMGVNNLALEP